MSQFRPEIPAALIQHRGDSAAEWLAALPDLIERCTEHWGLRVQPPFPELSYNYAAPAVRSDHEQVVLKLCPPDDEFATEVDALKLYGGRGMNQLLAAEESWGAMLLERLRPGTAIVQLTDDAEATGAALGVMQQYWTTPPAVHRFPDVADWFTRAFSSHERAHGGSGPIDPDVFARSKALSFELLATSGAPTVLHGDLNYGNVLSATRQPWLGIDPKGVIGEPIFDTSILLRDRTHRILAEPSPRRFLARRVSQIVDQTGFDRVRVVNWGIAYAILSAMWWAEGGSSGWEGAIACAMLLEQLN